jgi:light-regulated signal transduction histidine kinase (bacteriophytochrome)
MTTTNEDWEDFAEWSAYKDIARYVHQDGIIQVLENLWSYVDSPYDEHVITQLLKFYKDNEEVILRTPHLAQEYLDGLREDTPSV